MVLSTAEQQGRRQQRCPQLWGQEDVGGIVGDRLGLTAALRVLCLVSNPDLVTKPVVESAGDRLLETVLLLQRQ